MLSELYHDQYGCPTLMTENYVNLLKKNSTLFSSLQIRISTSGQGLKTSSASTSIIGSYGNIV